MKAFLKRFSVFFVLVLALSAGVAAFAAKDDAVAVKYATAGGAGSKNGSSWSNAMGAPELVKFLDTHDGKSRADIWVAAGTYSPGTVNSSTFNIKKGIKLYGGFAGNESSLQQRDWIKNKTILSGNAGGEGNASYHVVTCVGDPNKKYTENPTSSDTSIDGVTITGGRANGRKEDEARGGGMLVMDASPAVANAIFSNNEAEGAGAGMDLLSSTSSITNCTFIKNRTMAPAVPGGAVRYYNEDEGAVLIIEDCTFVNNSTTAFGGAIMGLGKDPSRNKIRILNSVFVDNMGVHGIVALDGIGVEIDGCAFVGNYAVYGALNMIATKGQITNCTFSENVAATSGGAIKANASEVDILNCTFAKNSSDNGGAITIDCGPETAIVVANSVFWGNKAAKSGDVIYISNEESDKETSVLVLANTTIKSGDVVINADALNYSSVISRDLVSGDPLIISHDKDNKPAVTSLDVRFYAINSGTSPAIGAGLLVGKQKISLGNNRTRDITVPAWDQLGAPRPNPLKGTNKTDIGATERYESHYATGVKISPLTASITAGETSTFKVTFTPEGSWGGPVVWSSSKSHVAHVEDDTFASATVRGVSSGDAVITVQALWNSAISADAHITVKAAPNPPIPTPTPTSTPTPTPAPRGPSSSGGCSAGYAPIAILLAASLLFRKK